MSMDSQQKRMSAAGAGRPWMRSVFPVASPTAAWRQNVGLSYAGLTLAAVTVTDGRTVSGFVAPVLTDGDKFRVRAVRTEGGSDLQTIVNGSAIRVMVYSND